MDTVSYAIGFFLIVAGVFADFDDETTLASYFFTMGLLLIINGTLVKILKQLRDSRKK